MQKLGKNFGGYFGETIKIHAVLSEAAAAANKNGWASETFFKTEGFQLSGLHKSTSPGSKNAKRIYISAGIHGDEPAGPLAALQLLQENRWPEHLEIWLCPCLNPIGFQLNSRANAKGIDLNRGYLNPVADEILAHIAWLERQPKFDLYFCLHEDWESQGFYLYEPNPDNQPSAAEQIILAVEKVCPIDRSELIEGRPAKNGIIRPNILPKDRLDWPEAFYLITHKTRHGYTLEAPSDFPLTMRVHALVIAVNTGINFIARDNPPSP